MNDAGGAVCSIVSGIRIRGWAVGVALALCAAATLLAAVLLPLA